jgi:hypothetical protein
MEAPDNQGLATLLSEAGSAHHQFEQEELGGERDEEWASWYARYLLDNGLGELVSRTPDQGELARLLDEATAEHEGAHSGQGWAEFTAAQLAERLS